MFLKYNRYISEKEVNKYPWLELIPLNGEAFGTSNLKINACGLVGTNRKANDGITFFGRKLQSSSAKLDFQMNLNGSNISQIYTSIIFLIYFRKEESNYYIKAYNRGSESIQLDNGLPIIIAQIITPYVSAKLGNLKFYSFSGRLKSLLF